MDIDGLLERLAYIEARWDQWRQASGCDCERNLEIRIRKFGGGTHYVRQCLSCGEQRGGSLKKPEALRLLDGIEPKDFDEGIEEARRAEYKAHHDESMALLDEYKKIKSLLYGVSDWESTYERERKEIEEARSELASFVEGFLSKHGPNKTVRALQAHTAAVKAKVYEELRASTERFTHEGELKTWLVSNLSKDFFIYPEVWGRHLAADAKIRIDYIFYPRKHLIESGFDPSPFGVEVKYFKQESGFTHKCSRAFWQTISYNDSEFFLKGKIFRLKFCLLFSNLSFSSEMALLKDYGHEFENDRVEWKGMVHVANHASVGTLEVEGCKAEPTGWAMKFAGGMYFCARQKSGGRKYILANENLVNRVRVGNF